MTDLPPLTATDYGRLAAAMVSVFVPKRAPVSRDVCAACGGPYGSLLQVDMEPGGRAESELCAGCSEEERS